MQIETKELTTLRGQVSKLENQASAITISNQEDYGAAIDIVSRLKDTGSFIKKRKESITKPLNEALKSARALFEPLETQFEQAEQTIKVKILGYKQRIDAEARAEEAKIAADLESGKIKKLETAERKLDAVERVESTTRGNVGQVQIRVIKKVRITDETLLPREYLIPDNVAIRRDALGGKIIPGVEIFDEETVAAGLY